MNIIIVGNGKVGYTLAQYLSKDGHDITVLDRNQQALNRAAAASLQSAREESVDSFSALLRRYILYSVIHE